MSVENYSQNNQKNIIDKERAILVKNAFDKREKDSLKTLSTSSE